MGILLGVLIVLGIVFFTCVLGFEIYALCTIGKKTMIDEALDEALDYKED